MADKSIECIVMFRNKAEEYKIPIPARQEFYGSHIEFQVTWYLGVFKFTNEEIIPQNMELDTKITFLDSIIPKLCLFFILAIWDGGHISDHVTSECILHAEMNRSYS